MLTVILAWTLVGNVAKATLTGNDTICGKRPHEVYVDCPDYLCRPQNCYEIGFYTPCRDPPQEGEDTCCQGVPGCYCEEGYVRNESGKCIAVHECPSCGGDDNAVSGCGVNCGRTCSTWNSTKPKICPRICKANACDCKPGFVKDENLDKCVLPKDCTPVCSKPNTIFDSCINGGCRSLRFCGDLDTNPNRTTLCIDPKDCIPGCSCAEGYLDDGKGNCIAENKCPNSKCKGDFEIYSPCTGNECYATSCDQLGYPDKIQCSLIYPSGSCPTGPGCVCRPGYLRNSLGKCVTQDQCPSCGGDVNAKPGCGSLCGGRCSNYWRKNIVCPLLCRLNSCDCKEGYVYDGNTHKCVRISECTPTCGQNEEYTKCKNEGCYGARNCSEIANGEKVSERCVHVKRCIPGCQCKKGYLKNDNGVCVLEKECKLNAECKGVNEFYDTCGPYCQSQSCPSLGLIIDCTPPPPDQQCFPQCRCAEGYFKNEEGICVLEQNCPKEPCSATLCPANEIIDRCINGNCHGPRTCVEYVTNNSSFICDEIKSGTCEVGCKCRDNWVRNERGICIPPYKCPKDTCPINEVYDDCVNGKCHGPRTCSDIRKFNDTICIHPISGSCRSGCICKNGLVRNDNGKCIPPSQCPSENDPNCGENEEYKQCPSTCPLQRCGIDDRLVSCATPPKEGDKDCLPPTCRCKSGFSKNSDGKCVKTEQCTQCSQNEVYDKCPDCRPRICGTNDAAVTCLPLNETLCEPRCRCQDGFSRNYYGDCVPTDQCPTLPQECGQNEVFDDCPNPCPGDSCRVDPRVIRCAAAPLPGSPDCLPRCRCIDGYAKNSDGLCIPREQCDYNKKCTGQNEEYVDCINTCSPNTCESIGKKYNCPIKTEICKGGCQCKQGYYRNKIGKCIAKEDCHTCPINEVYDDCVNGKCHGPRTCSDIRKFNGTICIDPISGSCRSGCICKNGLVRNNNGKCIPPSQCPSENDPTCGENEEYKRCPSTCPLQRCGIDDRLVSCATPPKEGDKDCLPPTCRCKSGFSRNSEGKCVKTEQCTQCSQNEVYDKCPDCRPRICGTNDAAVTCLPLNETLCEPRCRCQDGFSRNYYGDCVPTDQCPTLPHECGQNEVFDDCPNPCPGDSCSVDPRVVLCAVAPLPGSPDCLPRCRCIDGYAKNSDGLCIPREQCDYNKKCTGQNEEYVDCINTCSPNTCESIGKIYHCPIQTKICKGGCQCKPGYYRNKIGDCIAKEDCLKCTKPHEFFSCGGACDNICSRLSQYNQTNCPIINIQCNRMCYCESGYARDCFGECVPISQCRSCPGEHEWYNSCPSDYPETCEAARDNTYSSSASIPSTGCHKPSCSCEDDYRRDQSGKCIHKSQCPCNPNDPNSIIGNGCGISCARLCSTYNRTEPIFCTEECKTDQCDCKPGYVYDEITKLCTLPDKCTPKCAGVNEELSYCVEGLCREQDCSQKDEPVACPDLLPGAPCTKACVCKEGYLRDSSGKCINRDQCPKSLSYSQECGENEHNSTCIQGEECRVLTCKQISSAEPVKCVKIRPESCLTGCVCNEGYFRDGSGKCVPAEECPCGMNEEITTCIEGFCRIQNCSQKGDGIACIAVVPDKCTPACVCKEGYLRDKSGHCVPEKKCPPKPQTCGVNEELNKCIESFCRIQDCSQKGDGISCAAVVPDKCTPACVCKEGYLRDKSGKCIPEKKCPPKPQTCGVNEELNKCIESFCRIQDCSQKGDGISCAAVVPDKCTPACVCKEGYLRDKSGKCIPEKKCPPKPQTCGVNEELNKCIESFCRIQDCSQKGDGISCAAVVPDKCTPACVCKEGYLRDKSGKCIPEKKCPPKPPTCSVNEELTQCLESFCRIQDCSQRGDGIACIAVVPDKCTPACVCKEGYLRDKSGKCVAEQKCPPRPQCGANEELTKCLEAFCRIQDCSQKGEGIACAAVVSDICTVACVCKEGFLRDQSGRCVPERKCPPNPCGDHARNSTCIQAECRALTCAQRNQHLSCPRVIEGKCRCGCVCIEGYLKDAHGKCIKESQCPPVITTPEPKPCDSDISPGNNGSSVDTGNTSGNNVQLGTYINDFSYKFLKEVAVRKPGENIIISPFNFEIPFYLLTLKSGDNTRKQLLETLGLPNTDIIRQGVGALLQSLKNGDGVTIANVMEIFVNDNYKLNLEFKNEAKNIFNSTVSTIDCSDAVGSAKKINTYVADNTDGKITDLIPASVINDLMILISVNAIYFKGNWQIEFDKKLTEPRDFYKTENEVKQVQTMYMSTRLNYTYSSDLNAQIVALYYKDPRYKCVIVLPDAKDGLPNVLQKINSSIMDNILANVHETKVKLWLPTFEFGFSLGLKEILISMGIKDLFDSSAVLKGILDPDQDLYVSEALHKAYIKINEEGTEAAAATGIGVGTTSVGPISVIPEIKCDHPFLVEIRGGEKNTLLFYGAYQNGI